MGGLHARGVSRIREPAARKDSRHLSRQSLLVKVLLTWLCPEEKEVLHLGRMPPIARAMPENEISHAALCAICYHAEHDQK